MILLSSESKFGESAILLMNLQTTLHSLENLRHLLAKLPSRHLGPGVHRDLDRLELRILNLYRLTSSDLRFR